MFQPPLPALKRLDRGLRRQRLGIAGWSPLQPVETMPWRRVASQQQQQQQDHHHRQTEAASLTE